MTEVIGNILTVYLLRSRKNAITMENVHVLGNIQSVIAFSRRRIYMCAMVWRKCNGVSCITPVLMRRFCHFPEVLNMPSKGLNTNRGKWLSLMQVIVIISLVGDDHIIFVGPNNV
jgi:hypothetical protein